VDAAAVRQGAVLALLPAEVVVQLGAEASSLELLRRAEVVVAELPRRAEGASLELLRRAEVVVAELPRRAEGAAMELLRRVEAVVAELPRRAEAAYVRRCLEACSREAADWWCYYRWLDRR
jgi:hypothetical protein